MNKQQLLAELEKEILKARSTWRVAVCQDAYDLIDASEEQYFLYDTLESQLLNGASSWSEYSWGGCALVYNADIAKHYCTPSELKKTRDGLKKPNSREDWLDVQARALYQACRLIKRVIIRKRLNLC